MLAGRVLRDTPNIDSGRVDRHHARTAGVARRARRVGGSDRGADARRAAPRSASGLADELATDEEMAAAVVAVVTASRSLCTALDRDPAAVGMLRSEVLHGTVDSPREAKSLVASEDPHAALRRWKRQQIVRIAVRDLLGIAGLRDIVSELAASRGPASGSRSTWPRRACGWR